MGMLNLYLEDRMLSRIFRKTKRILHLSKSITICLFLVIISSSCVDYIELEDNDPNLDFNSGDNLEANVYEEINNYRLSKNLKTLKYSEEVAKIARLHSDNMATGDVEFGHNGQGDRENIVLNIMKNVKDIDENIAYGYLTAESVSKDWFESIGHKKNIEGDFTHTGVGTSTAKDGTIYYTQIFVKVEK